LLQQGLTESLAGRFETLHVTHWSFAEMQAAFGWNIEQYLYFGGYPGAASLIDEEGRWKNYVRDSLIETSISRDILMLTRIDKPALLKRLFEVASVYSGQILSLTKLLGQLQDAGNTTTLTNYLGLLSDCGLLGGLEKYAGEVVRQRASTPKFQVYNNALLNSQRTENFKDIMLNPILLGRLVESAIGAHLLNHSISGNYKVYYWREGNYEVDFVLKKGDKLVALEVKSGAKAINKGMQIFNEKFRPNTMLIVGTSGISYEEFLKINPIQIFDI
jgi:predicted AAA+ superfamily ATPase